MTEEATFALKLAGQMFVRQSTKLTGAFQGYGIVCAQKRKPSGGGHTAHYEQAMWSRGRAAVLMNEH